MKCISEQTSTHLLLYNQSICKWEVLQDILLLVMGVIRSIYALFPTVNLANIILHRKETTLSLDEQKRISAIDSLRPTLIGKYTSKAIISPSIMRKRATTERTKSTKSLRRNISHTTYQLDILCMSEVLLYISKSKTTLQVEFRRHQLDRIRRCFHTKS